MVYEAKHLLIPSWVVAPEIKRQQTLAEWHCSNLQVDANFQLPMETLVATTLNTRCLLAKQICMLVTILSLKLLGEFSR